VGLKRKNEIFGGRKGRIGPMEPMGPMGLIGPMGQKSKISRKGGFGNTITCIHTRNGDELVLI
jgi:hypothetical protein